MREGRDIGWCYANTLLHTVPTLRTSSQLAEKNVYREMTSESCESYSELSGSLYILMVFTFRSPLYVRITTQLTAAIS